MADQTTDEWATTQWEACGTFSPDAGGSPVCAGCGWLHDEHEHERDAVIRPLRASAPTSALPGRLAS